MQRRLALLGAVATLGAVFGMSRCKHGASQVADAVSSARAVDAPAAAQTAAAQVDAGPPSTREELLRGLELSHLALGDDGATSPLPQGRTAKLTLDTRLQRAATNLMQQHKLPEAAIVMVNPKNGEVLVYASHIEGAPARDFCAEAKAPSASVFKVVTASALVERAGLSADTKQCYAGGGEQRLTLGDLEDNTARDRWCPSLATALGKSTNTVFARLASKHLSAHDLESTAHALGYGEAPSFDVPVEASRLSLPDDKLGFARTAAGFWNSTLSPLEAASLSATMAHEGAPMRPFIVREIVDASGAAIAGLPPPEPMRRAIKRDTAAAVTTMMEHTISEGTSYRSFHDSHGKPLLTGKSVAGKTGTLNDPDGQHLYSWFTGFAPAHPASGEAQIAIAVLVVNQPKWHVKANFIAREMLRAWAQEGEPSSGAVAARAK